MSFVLLIGFFWIVAILYLLGINRSKEAFGVALVLSFLLCIAKISKYHLSINSYNTFINVITIVMLLPVIFFIFAIVYNKFKKQKKSKY